MLGKPKNSTSLALNIPIAGMYHCNLLDTY